MNDKLIAPAMAARTAMLEKAIPRTQRTLTLRDCGRMLGLSDAAMTYLRRRCPSFPAKKVGNLYAVNPEALRRWLYEVPEGIAWREWHEEHDRWDTGMLEARYGER